mmetsp:Transcript_9592/g.23158  ORF Transcript_9592/g.23158 Transcript_9592/m.23158 type:complete len:738 (-) Transcript_9592:121-2334(-)
MAGINTAENRQMLQGDPEGQPLRLTLSLDLVGGEARPVLQLHGLTPRCHTMAESGDHGDEGSRQLRTEVAADAKPRLAALPAKRGRTCSTFRRQWPPTTALPHVVDMLFGRVCDAMVAALGESTLQGPILDVFRELVEALRQRSLVAMRPSDASEGKPQDLLSQPPLPSSQTAKIFVEVASEMVALQFRHRKSQDCPSRLVLEIMHQAFFEAAGRPSGSLQSAADHFQTKLATRLKDVSFGVVHLHNAQPPAGAAAAAADVSSWACVVAGVVQSVFDACKMDSLGANISMCSLEYSNSACGSADFGAGATFLSANAGVGLHDFNARDTVSTDLFRGSLNLAEPLPEFATNQDLRAHLRRVLGQASADGRLQLAFVATDMDSTGKSSDDKGCHSQQEIVPVDSENKSSDASSVDGDLHLEEAALLPANNSARKSLGSAESASQRGFGVMVRDVLAGGLDRSNMLSVQARQQKAPLEMKSELHVFSKADSLVGLRPDSNNFDKNASNCVAKDHAQNLKGLRPWEGDVPNRADLLIRHLEEVGKDYGPAGIEKCLYADGVLPRVLPQRHARIATCFTSNSRGFSQMQKQADAADAGDLESRAGSGPSGPSCRSLLSGCKHAKTLPLHPDPASRVETYRMEERHDFPPRKREPQEVSRSLRRGCVVAGANNTLSEHEAKLPPLPPKEKHASAAAVYAQSFKKVSSDVADKNKLYRASRQLPSIQVRQRHPPEMPQRKWRPF